MYSANCRDYLEVPVNAVDDVTMTECEPPYISRCDDSNDRYVGVFVKNYKQSFDILFKRHVKIVSYYTLYNSKTSISSDDLRIRYSEKDGSFSYAKYNDYEANVYYTIDYDQNCVVIFTRHFSYYFLETNVSIMNDIQFPYKKEGGEVINLKADVYGKVLPGEGSSMIVSASVYILNVKDSRTDSFREYNNYREEKNHQKCKAFECKINMPLVFEKTAEISCKVALNNPEKVIWSLLLIYSP
jgi:hypothetical protein